MTFARRQTACGMRHCFARRIVETGGRRKLGCTATRSAERHPQGVCRIRKAAKLPTAAQQRIIEAEADRVAVLTRQRRAQEVASASIAALRAACSQCQSLSLGVPKGIFSFAKENIPFARSPAGTQGFSVCLDKQFQSWYADHNKRQRERSLFFSPAQERGRPVQVPAERKRRRF